MTISRYGRPDDFPAVTAAPGLYAVPDPDPPHQVMTTWRVTPDGDLCRYPPGHRWEPRWPDLSGIEDREARRAERERWYTERYWGWKSRLVEALNADPTRAAAEFRRQYPQVVADESAALALRALREERRQLLERRRVFDELWSAVLVRRGESIRSIAKRLGVSRDTALARAEAGLAAWRADPVRCRQLLERMLAGLGGEAGAVVDRLAVTVPTDTPSIPPTAGTPIKPLSGGPVSAEPLISEKDGYRE